MRRRLLPKDPYGLVGFAEASSSRSHIPRAATTKEVTRQ